MTSCGIGGGGDASCSRGYFTTPLWNTDCRVQYSRKLNTHRRAFYICDFQALNTTKIEINGSKLIGVKNEMQETNDNTKYRINVYKSGNGCSVNLSPRWLSRSPWRHVEILDTHVWLIALLISTLHRRWVVSIRLRRQYYRDKATGTRWIRGWVSLTADLWGRGIRLTPAGTRTQIPQSTTSQPNHYTEWAKTCVYIIEDVRSSFDH